jgi:hypothetical protein
MLRELVAEYKEDMWKVVAGKMGESVDAIRRRAKVLGIS